MYTAKKIGRRVWNPLFYLTYYLHLIKCYLTIIFYFSPPPSMVYIGNSEFLSDQSELKKLVDSIPMKFRGDGVVDPAKGFTRIGFKKLYRAKGGKAFVISILRLLKPLFEVYSVDRNDPLHLILSSGNTRPYHQDVQTGSNVYDESYKKDIDEYDWFCGKRYRRPANGLRVLIDLGSFNGHNSRRFSFAIEKSKNNFSEIFTTTARVIAMNAGAAGSGRKSDIYHGRFGDGVTVQLDLVLKKKSGIHGKATKIGLGGVISALIEKFVNK